MYIGKAKKNNAYMYVNTYIRRYIKNCNQELDY